MNVIDQLNVERQARGTAQSARDEKRQAIVSKQETLGVQALGLADEIARQVPILAQAVTWAGGGGLWVAPWFGQERSPILTPSLPPASRMLPQTTLRLSQDAHPNLPFRQTYWTRLPLWKHHPF